MKACAAAVGVVLALAAPVEADLNGTTFPASLQPVQTLQDACPAQCPSSGSLNSPWSTILSLHELESCPKPMLFQTSIRFPVESEGRQTFIRACTSSGEISSARTGASCVPGTNQTTMAELKVGWTNEDNVTASLSDLVRAAEDLERSMRQTDSCSQTVLFAKSGDAILGLYAGSEVDKASVSSVVQQLNKFINSRDGSLPSEMGMQICGPAGNRSSTRVVGVAANARGDIQAVHAALGKWADAECVDSFEQNKVYAQQRIATLPGASVASKMSVFQTNAMAECEYVQVESGDTCTTLAERCGIDVDTLIGHNGGKETWCNGLMPKEPVCCSEGDVPDLRPPPNEDGSCAVHTISSVDLCDTIEDQYYLEPDDLDNFNVGKTWGWAGCRSLQPGQKICVSDGDPPMPAYLEDAVCGPQVPGTERPDNDTEIADLNPCPLNVCCNIWGNCGVTEDFCIDTSIDDTPGTAENGTFGCVSNCGMDIVNDEEPPASFIRIAYFEAWNRERECLHMDVTDIEEPYTHIHFSFGWITEDFQVSAQGVQSQFNRLVRMDGIKRIISFGGWAFSNDPGTSHIMRSGVKPENRATFADKVVRFVNDNELDGVDFDWEYPGADDIPGSEPGTAEDGPNYLAFLKLVREGLGDNKVLAIAAPASYWYLRNFPIAEISEVVSYIVYMTYDLHGQWDVDNKFVSPGCPEGNCLRSHVNSTITHSALSMVTKAGVKSNKVVVGVSSYGRSFKMADPNCDGTQCHYLGERNESPAMPGECTGEGGYIANAEILKIEEDGEYSVERYWDEDSDSDIFIYNGVEWVGWMSDETKERRVVEYEAANFAGASDWAIDLQKWSDSDGGETVYIGDDVYEIPSMQCEAPCTIVLAPSPLSETTTISIPPYTTSLQVGTETVTVTITPAPITTDEIDFFNIPIPSNVENSTAIQPYPSLTVEDAKVPVTFVTNGETKTTTRTVALPPWPIITQGPPEDDDDDWDEPPTITGTGTRTPGPPPETVTHTWRDWYDISPIITPVPEKPEEPEPIPEDEGGPGARVPCDMYFFNTCPEDDNDEGGGWDWILPPGILPPGPPPPGYINPGPSWTVIGPLPPWPPMTIGGNGVPSNIPSKPNPCETTSAEMCGTTTSYGTSENPTETVTTTTSIYSTCNTIYGCYVSDWDTSTTTGDGCTLNRAMGVTPTPTASTSNTVPTPSASNTAAAAERLAPRAEDCDERTDVVVLPADILDVNEIEEHLRSLQGNGELESWRAISTETGDLTAFFWVTGLLKKSRPSFFRDDMDGEVSELHDPSNWSPDDGSDAGLEEESLAGRAGTSSTTNDYANALLSAPPDTNFYDDTNFVTTDDNTGGDAYIYHYDDSAGDGQIIYVVEANIDETHSAFEGAKIQPELRVPDWGPAAWDATHGTKVVSQIVGRYGSAPNALLVPVKTGAIALATDDSIPHRSVHGLLMIIDHLRANPNSGNVVINLSFAIRWSSQPDRFHEIFHEVMMKLCEEFNVVYTVAVGNDASNPVDWSPQRLAAEWDVAASSFLVGSVSSYGKESSFSGLFDSDEDNENLIWYTPGEQVRVADIGNGDSSQDEGTSLSAPRLAGLIAYLRGLPSDWEGQLTDPLSLKILIATLRRGLVLADSPLPDNNADSAFYPQFAWNGQVPTGKTSSKSCLLDPDPGSIEYNGVKACPNIPPDLLSCMTGGAAASMVTRRGVILHRQSDCDPGHNDGGNGNGGGSIGDLPVPGPITWGPGEPSPTCTSNCGEACDGFFCQPQPTGLPPDWEEPEPPEEEPEDPEDPEDPEEPPDEPELESPDPSTNERMCYDSGQKSSYGKIDAAAQSFCNNVGSAAEESGGVLSNFYKEAKKSPPGGYHFFVAFEVFDGCEWTYTFDECMRYYKVPIDSCDCSQQGDKQGGTVKNNCIYARIDPQTGQ